MDRETNEIGSFFVVAGNFHYDRKKKFQSSVWRVCRFLVLAGNWQFFCGGKFLLQPEKNGSGGKLAVFLLWRESFITTGIKKRYSRLSGGCVMNLY